MTETVPLGCPDCGAKWLDAQGPMQDLEGRRFECPACGRGYLLRITIRIDYLRH